MKSMTYTTHKVDDLYECWNSSTRTALHFLGSFDVISHSGDGESNIAPLRRVNEAIAKRPNGTICGYHAARYPKFRLLLRLNTAKDASASITPTGTIILASSPVWASCEPRASSSRAA